MNHHDKPTRAPSSHADMDRGPHRAVVMLLVSLTAFLIIAVAWMSSASLSIAVHAVGAVTPTSRVQNIQSMEGGIIREIAVHEGQQVKRGDLLTYVENLQYDADLGEGQQNQWAAQVSIERLKSELAGRAPVFSAELRSRSPALIAEQRKLSLSRRHEMETALETVRNQITQRQEELAEARSRVQSLTALLASVRETLAMEERLQAQRAGAKADFLMALREVNRVQGDLDAARIAVPRVQAALSEAQSRLASVEAKYRADTHRELTDLESKSAAMAEQLSGQQDRVQRRELRSPMDGVVNRILISTVGGVAKAGETIMELVPVQDTLLISARVKPSDIAFIYPGQKAVVRITAYDSSIFGSLDGKVVRVGADAIVDAEKKESYFEVILETERNYLGKSEERLIISSGMPADASIQTGNRTFMEYLLKPVIKTFDKALRER
jgi:adhesin transport system membrane fusion protein